jgi:hypothetical protein
MIKKIAVPLFAAAGILIAAQSSPALAAADSTLPTDHWLASDVYHAGVYDPQDNKIGDVDDLIINKDGSIAKAVIGVGGFLGVGQKDVALPFTDLKVKTKDEKSWLVLNTTKDQLKAAPSFDKNSLYK